MGPAADAPAEELLEFWFEDAGRDADALERRSAVWFRFDPAFDETLRARFGEPAELAARGGLQAWGESPRGALALVLLLDQLPRNLYRSDARAYAGDPRALALTLAALERGFDADLAPVEALFLAMPLEHAEHVAHQERMVAFCDALCERAPAGQDDAFQRFASYARRHRDVVRRFGRFPHRNRVLGRASTPEETAWLASGGDTFGG